MPEQTTRPRGRPRPQETIDRDRRILEHLKESGPLTRNQIADAIRSVHRGGRVVPATVAQKLAEYTPRIELTERELEVLSLMAQGQSNKEIADSIGRTEATVKVHVLHILSKLSVDDRTAAVTVALKRGMIHLT